MEINYERLYQEHLEDFKLIVHEFDKKLKAYFISDIKIPQEEFEEIYNTRFNLERILTLNMDKINKISDKLKESNDGYLDSVANKKEYEKLCESYQKIEDLITDVFDNFDRYEQFYNDSTTGYSFGAFKNLIDTFNSFPRFIHKLSTPPMSLDFLDKLADPYLKVIQGILEFLRKNDLINFASLERKLDIADERCEVFFGYHDKYNSPVAPKIRTINKKDSTINDLTIPTFFENLSIYLRDKLHKYKPGDFAREKLDPMTEEQYNNYSNGKSIHNPLSKEKNERREIR